MTEILFRNNTLTYLSCNVTLPSGLIILDVSHCKLRRIDGGVLRGLQSLEYLDVSHNRELTLDALPNITHDLQYTNIKVLKFNAIQCRFGEALTLKYRHIYHIQNTSMERIELSSNRIGRFEMGVIPSVPSTLRNVIAADNRFEFDGYMLELNSDVNVEYLDISNQYTEKDEYIKDLFDQNCNDKRSLLCKNDSKVPSWERIYTKTNITTSCLEEIIPKTIPTGRERFYVYVCFPKSLNTIILSKSAVRTHRYFQHLFFDYRSLMYYKADNNFREKIDNEVYSEKCTFLDFSYNNLKFIDPKYFVFTNLSHFNLTRNLLGKQISSNTSGKLLKGQRFLTWLSLGSNDIHDRISLKVQFDWNILIFPTTKSGT